MSERKPCEDCKWKRGLLIDPKLWQCVSPKNVDSTNKLTNTIMPIAEWCDYLHGNKIWNKYQTCGPDGLWFEPKERANSI